MNHTSDAHPWFQASRASRDGALHRLVSVARRSGIDRSGLPSRRTTGSRGSAARPGRSTRYAASSSTTRSCAEQPELDWRIPAVEGAQVDDDPRLARARRRRLPARHLQRVPEAPRLLLQPSPPRIDPRGHVSIIATTSTSRTSRTLLARFRAAVDAYPGTMTVGEMFVGTTEGAATLTRERHLVFDWELLTAPVVGGRLPGGDPRRERAFGTSRWPTVVLSNHDQPRQASRLAASVAGRQTDQDAVARRPRRCSCAPAGHHSCTTERSSGMGDVEVPADESIDPPAARVGPDFPWWDRSRSPNADALDGRAAGRVHHRGPAVAPAGDPTRNCVTSRRSRWTRFGARDVSPRPRRSPRDVRALQDGDLTLTGGTPPDVLAYRRSNPLDRRDEALVIIAFGPDAADIRLPGSYARGGWRALVGTEVEPTCDDGHGSADAAPASRGRHHGPRRLTECALLPWRASPASRSSHRGASRVPLDFLKRKASRRRNRQMPRRAAGLRVPLVMPEEVVAQDYQLKLYYAGKTQRGRPDADGPRGDGRAAGDARRDWPSRRSRSSSRCRSSSARRRPRSSRPSEAMQWLNAHHVHSPITRHALVVLESIDAVDLAFDTFACSLLDGEIDTSRLPGVQRGHRRGRGALG